MEHNEQLPFLDVLVIKNSENNLESGVPRRLEGPEKMDGSALVRGPESGSESDSWRTQNLRNGGVSTDYLPGTSCTTSFYFQQLRDVT
ncbi:hypothetical protein NQ318_003080 [Aromia moschata]|uniref:Uncharacterized protein n=1 Tax=Aromia moschata TaxID=1265417 RepID=A0AAV8XUK3_9CUCU|nr:hypothetical protein NQ318_003080 [Aromia moschata]